MAGHYNVMPTDLDVYAPERWRDDALFRPEVRKAYAEFVKLGWTNALRHLYPGKRIYTFWKYFRNAFAAMPGCASITCCSVLRWRTASLRAASHARCAVGKKPAITRRPGSN
jgi:hypothetical protein